MVVVVPFAVGAGVSVRVLTGATLVPCGMLVSCGVVDEGIMSVGRREVGVSVGRGIGKMPPLVVDSVVFGAPVMIGAVEVEPVGPGMRSLMMGCRIPSVEVAGGT